MSEITKEELKAFIEVQSKSVEQQVLIAERLKTIAEQNGKILEKVGNGMVKDIAATVCSHIDAKETAQSERRTDWGEKITRTDKNIERASWFIGIVGLVIVVATVVINGIDRRMQTGSEVHVLREEIGQLRHSIKGEMK